MVNASKRASLKVGMQMRAAVGRRTRDDVMFVLRSHAFAGTPVDLVLGMYSHRYVF